ncbi:VOC family protein [Nocardia sp. CA2R105]|uniref:VOC family protein n=1 Tax=Nocardia coffeae TaxID=2873381 RepID=UPI001CA73D0F|nr:VOC family protein [Nocardia coffeae]MBY8862301.1 VOC family protein [Nocardia coffeae]
MTQMKFGPLMQHGYVVADAAKAAAEWSERLGIGPFYLLPTVVEDYLYRGTKSKLDLLVGMSYWNDIQIEVIQPVGDGESLYTEAVRTGSGALNHQAVLVSNINVVVRDSNLEKFVVHRGSSAGLAFLYLENYLPDGSHLELIDADARILRTFDAVQTLCRTWDGSRPVRHARELSADLAALSRSR